MFEPFSTTLGVCWLGYSLGRSTLHGVQGSSAVSEDAVSVRERATEVVMGEEGSQFLFGKKADAISDLRPLVGERSQWGSADEKPLNMLAVFLAERFVRALPNTIPVPDITADPDGTVSLNWMAARHRRLTLSVAANQRIAFAWLNGTERGYGVTPFDGLNIPSRIVDEINRLGDGNTSLRAA